MLFNHNFNIAFVLALSLLLMVLSLSACSGDDAAQTVDISGQLSYAADVPLPKQATAEISLVQLTDTKSDGPHILSADAAAMASKRIVAKQTLHGLASLPVAFDLKVSGTLLKQEGRYALTAQIGSENGRPRWRTAVPQAIDLQKTNDDIHLTLSPTPWNDAVLTFMHMACADGFAFAVATFNGRAALRIGERGFELKAVHAVSGARYAANDVWLWQQTNGGSTISVDDKQHRGCQPLPDRILSTQPAAEDVDKPE